MAGWGRVRRRVGADSVGGGRRGWVPGAAGGSRVTGGSGRVARGRLPGLAPCLWALVPLLTLVALLSPPPAVAGVSPNSGQRLAGLYQMGDPAVAGRRYGLVILNEWNAGWIAPLKAADPTVRVLLYKNTFFLRSDDNASTVGGFRTGEDIDTAHPDWFLKDSAGRRIIFHYYPGIDFYAMDWGNEGWRAYWVDRALDRATALGFDGLFLDDLYATRYGVLDRSLARYRSDAALQAAVRGFLAQVYGGAKDLDPDFLVVGNVVDHLLSPGLFADWLTISDGLMDEQFVHVGQSSRTGFKSLEDRWKQQLEEVETAERMGKAAIFVSHGASSDPETMLFAYCTYLLAADGSSYFHHILDGSLKKPTWYEVWERELGMPLGPYEASAGGVFTREFSKGKVVVNPRSAGSRTVDVRGYTNTAGVAVDTVTLGPHRAAILHRRFDSRLLVLEYLLWRLGIGPMPR